MANYNKQFNFRNGVQVDNDNFVVSPTGLVGIGTTIPTQAIDAYGNVKISGFATASTLYSTSLEVNGTASVTDVTFTSSVVGAGVSIASGIITSYEISPGVAGIVTYYGDARFLQGMPTSQWVDVDAGLGYTSIYAAGNVGVGTTDPRFTFQVGGVANNSLAGFGTGVGISSGGDVLISGITTAYKFVGIGSDLTLLDANNLTLGTISNDRIPVLLNSKLPQDIIVGGGLTVTNDLVVGSAATAIHFESNTVQSGVITATTNFVGNITGNLTGVASSASSLVGTPNISVGIITANAVSASSFIGGITGTASTAASLTPDAEVDIADLTVGVATVTTLGIGTNYLTGRVAIGSDSPSNGADILLRRVGFVTTSALVQIISEKSSSSISIGRSDSINAWNTVLRYGHDDGSYSTPYSFSILNKGDGNINHYLQAGAVGVNTGSYYWHFQSNPLMTLTYGGRLGIGITLPEHTLDVAGTLRSSGIVTTTELYVTGDTTVGGDLNVIGNITLPDVINANVTGNLTGNVDAQSGISTFTDVTSSFIGIGTDSSFPSAIVPEKFSVNSPGSGRVFIDQSGNIGIKTTIINNQGITAPQVDCLIAGVGIGTTRPRCAIDFSFATNNDILGQNRDTVAYVLFPKLTTTQRNNLTNVDNAGVEDGAIIYNTDNTRLELKLPNGWCGIATIA